LLIRASGKLGSIMPISEPQDELLIRSGQVESLGSNCEWKTYLGKALKYLGSIPEYFFLFLEQNV